MGFVVDLCLWAAIVAILLVGSTAIYYTVKHLGKTGQPVGASFVYQSLSRARGIMKDEKTLKEEPIWDGF